MSHSVSSRGRSTVRPGILKGGYSSATSSRAIYTLPSNPISTSITERIPQEVFDGIIDYYSTDSHALAACSLVCAAWLHSARYHNFAKVTIRPRRAIKFLEILGSPLATIGRHIQQLSLIGLGYGADSHVEDILPGLSGLVEVRLFRFESLGWPLVEIEYQHLFENLTELELKAVEFPTFEHIVHLMYALPSLQRLAMHLVWWRDESPPAPEHLPPLHRLKTLALGSCFQAELLEWFLSHGRIPAVNTVRLKHMTPSHSNAVGTFLRALGAVLKHLDIYESPYLDQVNLSHNTSLRSLRINAIDVRSQDPEVVAWIPMLLAQIQSPGMEVLLFAISLYSIHDLDALDWTSLARIFEQPHFAGLRRVEFRVSKHRKLAKCWIRERLPGCDVRGILLIEPIGEVDTFWD